MYSVRYGPLKIPIRSLLLCKASICLLMSNAAFAYYGKFDIHSRRRTGALLRAISCGNLQAADFLLRDRFKVCTRTYRLLNLLSPYFTLPQNLDLKQRFHSY